MILTSYPQNPALHCKYRYLPISAKRAKQANPPHLANVSDFMMSNHENEHGFRGDPKQRYIGDISGTKSKNEHVFRVLLNGTENIGDIRQSAAFSKKRMRPYLLLLSHNIYASPHWVAGVARLVNEVGKILLQVCH